MLELPLLLALLAGTGIFIGALLSRFEKVRSYFLEREIDSFVSYFGGGALLAAVALVLVPHGIESSSLALASLSFMLGGLVFWRFSTWLQKRGGSAALFAGMLLDFVPESVALGAAAAKGSSTMILLALLIGLQNLPEGFASFHEMRSTGVPERKLWPAFLLSPLAGPLAAWLGYSLLSDEGSGLAALMLFSSGGIVYLIFEDIAPESHIKHESFPALGSVLGFVLGMAGTMLIH